MESPPTNLDLGTGSPPLSNVVHLHNLPQIYSLQEARALLPLISKLTRRWHERADKVLLSFHYSKNVKKRNELEKIFNAILEDWADAIEKLGPVVKGPWLVDFDSGDGNYWCWQYPEEDILYQHSHVGGFQSRSLIRD